MVGSEHKIAHQQPGFQKPAKIFCSSSKRVPQILEHGNLKKTNKQGTIEHLIMTTLLLEIQVKGKVKMKLSEADGQEKLK